MLDTTMGQRIAHRRKLLNLSQEAFGDKLGVSRQAISKWEADGAIPEIDKLIAMSKLFGVTVGWLLGVEEDSADQNPDPGFTEEQMRIVEGIAEQYTKPNPQHRPILSVVGCCAAVILTVCLIVFSAYANYVSQELNGLYAVINFLERNYSNLDGHLSQVTDRLDELTANERLLAEYDVEVDAWEDGTGATVHFTGIPNNTKAQDEVWFSVRLDGEEVANALCTMDGSAYVAEVELPAANGYSYYLQAVHTGGDSSHQVLELDECAVDLATGLAGKIHANITQWGWHLTESTLYGRMNVERALPALGSGTYDWTQIELVILLNGTEIDRRSLLEENWEAVKENREEPVLADAVDCCSVYYSFPVPQLTEGDQIMLVMEYNGPANVVITRNMARMTVLRAKDGHLSMTRFASTDD